ncbi:MAG: tyrosine-type recombinase/integrase [Dehalococcoidales bacterium]|nr:tyrosine-type recombinase/integrase [Dehalococcoidales bacterium]
MTIVSDSVRYFVDFLASRGLSTEVTKITPYYIRAFIMYLQQKRCFSNHRLNRPKEKSLSGHTVNCYLRSVRAFFSWLVSEGIIENSPFDRVKIPKAPKKVIPTFSDSQIQDLISVIDIRSPEGFRDYTIILVLLDTAMRVSELCHLQLDDVWLEDGLLKVLGKGNKERLIPIGKQVQKCLWRYISRYRPEPQLPNCNHVFLTRDGRPLTKDRVEKIIARYGKKAALTGVRCSPHTFRHTATLKFLRNGGDVFTLQKMLGHASLEMTRRYCELADIDVKKAHTTASPVDNLFGRINLRSKNSNVEKKKSTLRRAAGHGQDGS